MDLVSVTSIADILAAWGPYGFVAVLGWAFWKVNERKDRELKAIYNQMIQLSEQQTAAITKVEAALVALKEAIDRLR